MIHVVVALIHRGGRWFLQRRDPAGLVLPGLWEFPGGKMEKGETLEKALRRELREELAWVPKTLRVCPAVSHPYEDRTVVLHPFLCEGFGEPRTELGWGWFRPAEAAKLPIPEANHLLLASLSGLGENPSAESS